MIEPKTFLEEIKNDRKSLSDRNLSLITGSIRIIEKVFPERSHFLMEFIQNSDDAKSLSLQIEINKDKIIIYNNGEEFSEKNVESICDIGHSSKTPEDYIGYLGVGFKSVFLISDCPEIHSGYYRFKFQKPVENFNKFPWQVTPIWIESSLENIKENDEVLLNSRGSGIIQLWQPLDSEEFRVQILHKDSGDTIRGVYPKSELGSLISNVYTKGTKFIIPLSKEIDKKILEKLEDDISTENLNNRIILFLRNIKRIEINDKVKGIKRDIVKIKDESIIDPNYSIFIVEEYENEVLKTRDRWLLFNNPECSVPEEVKKDQDTIRLERQDVKKREVVVVFRLDKDGNLMEEKRGTAHTGVFSFLPLKEVESGLKFLIQADFLTTPGRTDIQRTSAWNEWMANEIYQLVINKCIPEFKKNDKWKFNFTKILYPKSGGHELFDKLIKKPLENYIPKNSLFITENNSTAKIQQLVLIPSEIRNLLDAEDLKLLYPNKIVMHNNCKIDFDLYQYLERSPTEMDNFLEDSKTQNLLNIKARSGNVEWFKKIYSALNNYNLQYFRERQTHYNVAHDEFWNRMHDFPIAIILTNRNELAKVPESYIANKNLDIPKEIESNFKIVHPIIREDKDFKIFRDKLNKERYYYALPDKESIKELTKEEIENALKTMRTLDMNEEKWHNLSENEKISKIKDIKNLSKKYGLDISSFGFLTVKTKSGKWLKPEEVIFSMEYKPDHRIETIMSEGFLDFDIEFLSPIFIEGLNESHIKEWNGFFKNLGVDNIILEKEEEQTKKNISQRIGVLVSLKFEKEIKKRTSRELAESERENFPGCDVFSIFDENREKKEFYIQVKGRAKSKPQILLSRIESDQVNTKKEKYLLYMVGDALNNPTMYVLRGDKILLEKQPRIAIDSGDWENLKEDKYQPLLE